MAGKLFEIKQNLFDSGLLAPKVGDLILPPKFNFQEDDIEMAAQRENYNLIALSSETKREFKKFKYMGTLIGLETEITTFQKKIDKLSDKYKLRDFSEDKWPKIKKSIPQLWGSRFSQDENIPSNRYQEHKLKLIKHYYNNFPVIFKIIESENQLDAFLFSYLENEELVYYEGFITERYRTGLLGASLLKQSVLAGILLGAKKVRTNVYSNNLRFLKTYLGLGFKEIGRRHYYHLWPKLSCFEQTL